MSRPVICVGENRGREAAAVTEAGVGTAASQDPLHFGDPPWAIPWEWGGSDPLALVLSRGGCPSSLLQRGRCSVAPGLGSAVQHPLHRITPRPGDWGVVGGLSTCCEDSLGANSSRASLPAAEMDHSWKSSCSPLPAPPWHDGLGVT